MNKRKRRSVFVYFYKLSFVTAAVLLSLTCQPASRAQSESINATIRGRISDPSDQPAAGAKATAVNIATGYSRSVDSAEDGYYVIASLPLGTYTVTLTKDGFATLKFTEIVLQAGQEAARRQRAPQPRARHSAYAEHQWLRGSHQLPDGRDGGHRE
jgi:hypothetical protein